MILNVNMLGPSEYDSDLTQYEVVIARGDKREAYHFHATNEWHALEQLIDLGPLVLP